MVRGVISPFSPPPTAPRSGAPPTNPTPATPGDGYSGSIGANPDHQPPARKRSFLPVALFGALALGGIAGLGAANVAQHAAPIAVSQPAQAAVHKQAPTSAALSNPTAPEPEIASPDAKTWENNAQQAFDAWHSGDVNKFESLTSADGVWVRGLPGQPTNADGYTHLTHQELDQDLHHHGSFERFTIEQHGNARFVTAPDGSGLVETILLD